MESDVTVEDDPNATVDPNTDDCVDETTEDVDNRRDDSENVSLAERVRLLEEAQVAGTQEGDGPSVEDRLAMLEYNMSRVPHLLPRAPVTNPIDDPDDAPMIPDENDPTNPNKFRPGSWEGHPWHGLGDK